MRIDKLYLKNFRIFSDEEFQLHPSFTVFIGNNGAGKSSILHALNVATATYLHFIPGVYRRGIWDDDIRIWKNLDLKDWVYETPTIVEATGVIDERNIKWRRTKARVGGTTSHNNADVGVIQEIATNHLKALRTSEKPLLPVIAYYSTIRASAPVRASRSKSELRTRTEKGYYGATGDKVDRNGYINWLYKYEKALKNNDEFEGTREAMFEAIETAIPYLKEVSFALDDLQIEASCEIPGQPPKILQHYLLSDGLKVMLGMVADLAYRCVMLNGHLGRNCVKDSKGIVMIDELELHLHPEWQRHVVGDFQKAFPQIQFIVTTHSPVLLSSMRGVKIQSLKDEKSYDVPKLYGKDANSTLLEMETDYRIKEVKQKLDEYYLLIEKGQGASQEALNVRKLLEDLIGKNDSELQRADSLIAFLKQ